MATTTTNYGLTKPATTDNYDIRVPNGNMDKIDAELKKGEDHRNDTVAHMTQAQKDTLASAVQNATIGGASVPKSKTTLQLPAYPVIPGSLPANGGNATTLGRYYESDFYHINRNNVSDCDLALTPGEYSLGGTVLHGPAAQIWGRLIVSTDTGKTYNGVSGIIWQRIEALGDIVYRRNAANGGAFSAWSKPPASTADYASGSVALTAAGLRNAIIIPKDTAIPTGLADGTVVLRYDP